MTFFVQHSQIKIYVGQIPIAKKCSGHRAVTLELLDLYRLKDIYLELLVVFSLLGKIFITITFPLVLQSVAQGRSQTAHVFLHVYCYDTVFIVFIFKNHFLCVVYSKVSV